MRKIEKACQLANRLDKLLMVLCDEAYDLSKLDPDDPNSDLIHQVINHFKLCRFYCSQMASLIENLNRDCLISPSGFQNIIKAYINFHGINITTRIAWLHKKDLYLPTDIMYLECYQELRNMYLRQKKTEEGA